MALGWHGPHPYCRGPAAESQVASVAKLSLHHCMLWNEPGGEIAPQPHDQLARQRDDGDAPGVLAGVGRAGTEPLAERTIWLMAKPEPCEFDRFVAGPMIARLADPLLAIDAATLPGTLWQAAIAGDLAPVAEVLVEQLIHQRRAEGGADRLDPQQAILPLCHRRRKGKRSCHLRLLERRQLLADQHQPRVLACYFGQKLRRQRLSLPVTLLLKPGEPVLSSWIADGHSVKTQQRLDPVGMGCLLGNQPVAFAAGASGIFLCHARHTHDSNHPWLAPQIGHQGAQQQLAVDPVRLRPSGALLHRNGRRIEHQVPDPSRLEQPVQQKAIIASLVAARYRRHRAELPGRPGSDLLDQRQQPAVIAPRQLMPRNPVSVRAMQRHQPCFLTEFDRDENRATTASGGRDYGRSLHPTSPMVRVYKPKPTDWPRSPPHGIYELRNQASARRLEIRLCHLESRKLESRPHRAADQR